MHLRRVMVNDPRLNAFERLITMAAPQRGLVAGDTWSSSALVYLLTPSQQEPIKQDERATTQNCQIQRKSK